MDQNDICRSLPLSSKEIRKNPEIIVHNALTLSNDILEEDNELLIGEATDEEIHQPINQINSLKAPEPDGIHAVCYQRC